MRYDNQVFEVSGALDTSIPLQSAIEYASGALGITALGGFVPAIQFDPMKLKPSAATFSPVFLGLIPAGYEGQEWVRWEDCFHTSCPNAAAAASAIQKMFMERFDSRVSPLEECFNYGPGTYDRGFHMTAISHTGIAYTENESAPPYLRIQDIQYGVFKIRPTLMFRGDKH